MKRGTPSRSCFRRVPGLKPGRWPGRHPPNLPRGGLPWGRPASAATGDSDDGGDERGGGCSPAGGDAAGDRRSDRRPGTDERTDGVRAEQLHAAAPGRGANPQRRTRERQQGVLGGLRQQLWSGSQTYYFVMDAGHCIMGASSKAWAAYAYEPKQPEFPENWRSIGERWTWRFGSAGGEPSYIPWLDASIINIGTSGFWGSPIEPVLWMHGSTTHRMERLRRGDARRGRIRMPQRQPQLIHMRNHHGYEYDHRLRRSRWAARLDGDQPDGSSGRLSSLGRQRRAVRQRRHRPGHHLRGGGVRGWRLRGSVRESERDHRLVRGHGAVMGRSARTACTAGAALACCLGAAGPAAGTGAYAREQAAFDRLTVRASRAVGASRFGCLKTSFNDFSSVGLYHQPPGTARRATPRGPAPLGGGRAHAEPVAPVQPHRFDRSRGAAIRQPRNAQDLHEAGAKPWRLTVSERGLPGVPRSRLGAGAAGARRLW